jgi:hypothetical protein
MAPIARTPPCEETTPASLQLNSSPGNSLSDKENRAHSTHAARPERKKRPGETMASNAPMPPPSASSNKRQRLTESSSNIGAQSQTWRSQRVSDNPYYDPDQDENERRRIRKEFRDLTRELHGIVSSLPYYISLSHINRLPRRISPGWESGHSQYLTESKRAFHARQTDI